MNIVVENARIADVPHIHELVNHYAHNEEMLPRAMSEIYEDLRDYFVIRNDEGKVIACVALHISWADMGEIRSLAVDNEYKKNRLGSILVQACLDDAHSLGIPTVFCFTYKQAFFEKCNFILVDKMDLPRKVWSECLRCPKFPDCDEVALIYHLEPAGVTK